jgi:hypothetical protein
MDRAHDLNRIRRLAVAGTLLVVACGLLASSARAATVAITAGADPTESITTQFGATGSVTDPQNYVVEHYKPVGGAACGANPSADDGLSVSLPTSYLPVGTYAAQSNVTIEKAGDYLVCAWLMQYQSSGPNTVAAAESKVVRVRIPSLMLAVAPSVPSVAIDQTFQVTATAQAETQRNLYLYVMLDTGRGCPANAAAASAADSAVSIFTGRSIVGGPTSQSSNLSLRQAGTWLLCAYIHHNSSAEPPQATAQGTVTVLAPPPPCVVPAIVVNEPLAQTRARVLAASCTVGKVRYVASTRYARGSVFKVAPTAGTSLATSAPIDLWVSSGAPCIVPTIPRSRTLTAVRRRLIQSGCTPGRVTHRRSRSVRKGRVLSLGKARGTKLSPRSSVSIVISSGHR